MINESIMTNDESPKLKTPLDRLASGEHPIEHIVNGEYEILGLQPYELLKGYKIIHSSHNVWGLYVKNVIDHEIATLTTENKGGKNYVIKYIINYA
jgi:hypothetical protein